MIGQVRSREMIKSISQVAERYAHKDTLLAARHLLELGEGPVGGLGEVRHGSCSGGCIISSHCPAYLDLKFSSVSWLVLTRFTCEGIPPEILSIRI